MQKNRHGLSRHIPASVTREVRQRSKFGCVMCRIGFYEYEHINPGALRRHAHTMRPIFVAFVALATVL